MYEKLEKELEAIQTRKFHIIDGPASPELRSVVEANGGLFPESYRQFVLRFGNAKLYRQLSYYLLGVLAAPRREVFRNDQILYRVGHFQSSGAFFKSSLLAEGKESPVFELINDKMIGIGDGFADWFTKRSAHAASSYSKREWKKILAGPPPFSEEELMIVAARKAFTWRVIGVDASGKLLMEVHNGSSRSLKFYSIGVRKPNVNLEGGLWLPVSHIPPSATGVVAFDAYGPLKDLSEIEIFQEPDPEPEDRDRFWEFRT